MNAQAIVARPGATKSVRGRPVTTIYSDQMPTRPRAAPLTRAEPRVRARFKVDLALPGRPPSQATGVCAERRGWMPYGASDPENGETSEGPAVTNDLDTRPPAPQNNHDGDG